MAIGWSSRVPAEPPLTGGSRRPTRTLTSSTQACRHARTMPRNTATRFAGSARPSPARGAGLPATADPGNCAVSRVRGPARLARLVAGHRRDRARHEPSGLDLTLARYANEGWRATFFNAG